MLRRLKSSQASECASPISDPPMNVHPSWPITHSISPGAAEGAHLLGKQPAHRDGHLQARDRRERDEEEEWAKESCFRCLVASYHISVTEEECRGCERGSYLLAEVADTLQLLEHEVSNGQRAANADDTGDATNMLPWSEPSSDGLP